MGRAQVAKRQRVPVRGYLGHYTGRCRRAPDQVLRYRHKISGPLLDRIDLQIDVPAVDPDGLSHGPSGATSGRVRERAGLAVRARISAARGPRCSRSRSSPRRPYK